MITFPNHLDLSPLVTEEQDLYSELQQMFQLLTSYLRLQLTDVPLKKEILISTRPLSAECRESPVRLLCDQQLWLIKTQNLHQA